MKNSLNIEIRNPSQVLYIMRGVSGTGKSTKARELAGNTGVIHSTDDVISGQYDYNEFFLKMKINNDFGMLNKMHSQNFKNFTKSLSSGISPIVIDNTNLHPSDVKEYAYYALKFGLDDKNIHIVNIPIGNLTANELAARNKHGVSSDIITKMIQRFNHFGDVTLETAMKAKLRNNILYSGVILSDFSNKLLLSKFDKIIPDGWVRKAHHMTIVFGKGVPNEKDIGKMVGLYVTHVGISHDAIAVKVFGYYSANKIKHITLAFNPDGGGAVKSNEIKIWKRIKPFKINGLVKNIYK